MNEMRLSLCEQCADKMDANLHEDGTYYLQAVAGSRHIGICLCGRTGAVMQYKAESKAVRAFRRAMARKAEGGQDKQDGRARYRGPWRERTD